MTERAGAPEAAPRVLVLNASPRPDGNTMALARLFLACLPGARRETLSAYALAVRPCTACGGCAGGAPCVVRDGMDRVWEALSRANIVVVASPLHFSSLTAPMVAVISRWQPAWEARRAGAAGGREEGGRRRGVLVATGGGAYPNMFESARRVAAAGFATLGIAFRGVLSAGGLDAPGGAVFSTETRRAAEDLARGVLSCSASSR